MKVISSTALACNQTQVTYEILRSASMLVFKPAYHYEVEDFPCVILTQKENGWSFRGEVDTVLKEQIMEDIACLKIR